ncbi:vegetative cell wall protein gp1-like, partial [Empidonax traillii]|uniref:vegetative cell wall protein gp1-like n=1 Tax=Empidonax traillii TaxID=164674 RepID=UPI000FFDAD71
IDLCFTGATNRIESPDSNSISNGPTHGCLPWTSSTYSRRLNCVKQAACTPAQNPAAPANSQHHSEASTGNGETLQLQTPTAACCGEPYATPAQCGPTPGLRGGPRPLAPAGNSEPRAPPRRPGTFRAARDPPQLHRRSGRYRPRPADREAPAPGSRRAAAAARQQPPPPRSAPRQPRAPPARRDPAPPPLPDLRHPEPRPGRPRPLPPARRAPPPPLPPRSPRPATAAAIPGPPRAVTETPPAAETPAAAHETSCPGPAWPRGSSCRLPA